MQGSRLALSIPPISDELFKDADRTFAQIEIEPDVTSHDEIMFNAGARCVIRWLEMHRRHTVVTGGSE